VFILISLKGVFGSWGISAMKRSLEAVVHQYAYINKQASRWSLLVFQI